MNSQEASLFLAPAGMPQPCEPTPGKRPLGPAGMIEKLTLSATLLEAASPSWTSQAWLKVMYETRPCLQAFRAVSYVYDSAPSGPYSPSRRA